MLLGSSLLDTRLNPPGAVGVDFQSLQITPRFGVQKPPHRVNETDSLNGHALASCGFPHHHPDQVVYHRGDHQLFQHTRLALASQDIHLHRLLQVTQICLYRLAGAFLLAVATSIVAWVEMGMLGTKPGKPRTRPPRY